MNPKARRQDADRGKWKTAGGQWNAYLYPRPKLFGRKEDIGSHLRSCLRRDAISSPRRAEPSSAVSTLCCSLAFSPARRRLLSSRSSRLLSSSAVAGLRAARA